MKALIRNQGETVTENDGIVGIDWNTGAPLTNTGWCGGPYIMVDDYVQEVPVEGSEEPQPIQSTPVEEKPAEQPSEALPETRSSESEGAVTESPSTVTYGGKEYTLEELKKLIG